MNEFEDFFLFFGLGDEDDGVWGKPDSGGAVVSQMGPLRGIGVVAGAGPAEQPHRA